MVVEMMVRMVRLERKRKRLHRAIGELNAKLMFEAELEVEVFLTLSLMGT